MLRILLVVGFFSMIFSPLASAEAEKIKVPDCLSGKQRRFLIEVETKDLSKDEVLTILYQASGPNHPSYIAPESGPSFTGAGVNTMSIGLSVYLKPTDAFAKERKLTQANINALAKSEIAKIAENKGVKSISCY